MTDESIGRRTLLRNLALGGAIGTAGGAGVTAFRDSSGTFTSTFDNESFPRNRMGASSFELETAWLIEHEDEATTVPAQSIEDFPERFGDEVQFSFPVDEMEPGTTGRVLAAFRTCSGGQVAFSGTLAGSDVLAGAIDVRCWRAEEWKRGQDPSDTTDIYTGPLSTFPAEPFAPTPCTDCSTVQGIGVTYSVPDVSEADDPAALADESLRFELQLHAESCRPNQ